MFKDRLFGFLKIVGTPYLKIKYKINVIGKTNIPKQNGFIIASNHINNDDQFIIAKALTGKTFSGLASTTIKKTFRGRLFSLLGVVYVDRNNPDDRKRAKQELEEKLLNGENCLVFPEGTRKIKHPEYINEKLMPLKYGVVSMSQKTGASVLPIGLKYEGRGVTVNIGEIFSVLTEDDLTEANNRLRDRLIDLLK